MKLKEKKAKNQLTFDWSKKTAAIRLAPASTAGSSRLLKMDGICLAYKKIEENGLAGVYMTWVGVSFGFGE
jgi:hypothetical protein